MYNCEMTSNMLDEEASCSMSYGALVQQSAAVLRNECEILEAKIREKARDSADLKELCARQAENIKKQQSEMEHWAVKMQSEGMLNKHHMSRVRNMWDMLQTVDKYCEKWGKTINTMLGYKNELDELIKQLKVIQEMQDASEERLEEENHYYLQEAAEALLLLQSAKDREKTELTEIKTHLSNQLEDVRLQEKEREEELREVECLCREKQIMIDILGPQRDELKKTLENLETEFAEEKKQMNFTNSKLNAILEEELKKNNQLSTKLEAVNRTINEITEALREKEIEIKALDSKQKQLNVEEEEKAKLSNIKQQELQKLESTVEELTSQLNELKIVEEENTTLKVTCENLQSESNNYLENIAGLERKEVDYNKNIRELSKYTEDLEIEIKDNIRNRVVIEDTIKTLKKEENDNEEEHKNFGLKIDKISAELQDKDNSLIASLRDISKQILDSRSVKIEFEKTLKNLERELAGARVISQESDFKLSSYHDECTSVNKALEEEMHILNETMLKYIADYEKATSDCLLNENTKKEIQQLTKDLENKVRDYEQTFYQLQETCSREIENKNKAMSESRVQWEREFRGKEVIKTDAFVELKETKARIIDLQKQKVQIEKEIERKEDILKKCDNLIHRLETKFKNVAQVARVAASGLSVSDPASQQTNIATPSTLRKHGRVESPSSDSSGKTFDPDDMSLRKVIQKRPAFQPILTHQNVPKKKPTAAPSKKKTAVETDEWGFPL